MSCGVFRTQCLRVSEGLRICTRHFPPPLSLPYGQPVNCGPIHRLPIDCHTQARARGAMDQPLRIGADYRAYLHSIPARWPTNPSNRSHACVSEISIAGIWGENQSFQRLLRKRFRTSKFWWQRRYSYGSYGTAISKYEEPLVLHIRCRFAAELARRSRVCNGPPLLRVRGQLLSRVMSAQVGV